MIDPVERRRVLIHNHDYFHISEEQKGSNEALICYLLASTYDEAPTGPCQVDRNIEAPVSNQIFEHFQPTWTEGKEVNRLVLELLDVPLTVNLFFVVHSQH